MLGVPIGLVAGYLGGWVDEGIMRCFDALRVFPAMILALAVVAAAGPSLLNVVLVIGLLDSPMFARIVRAEVLVLRNSVFVEASIAIGNPTWRLLLVHLLRNSIKGALAQVAVRMAWAVRISATLAFLGSRHPGTDARMGCHDPPGHGVVRHRAMVGGHLPRPGCADPAGVRPQHGGRWSAGIAGPNPVAAEVSLLDVQDLHVHFLHAFVGRHAAHGPCPEWCLLLGGTRADAGAWWGRPGRANH